MNAMEEGYVKFEQTWQQILPRPAASVAHLVEVRQALYEHGLIGYSPELAVGFGNLSRRCTEGEPGLFIISGTQTGQVPQLGPEHFTTVVNYDLGGNRLRSEGPLRASSESLTHAALYAADAACQAVLHVHHLAHWQRLYGHFSTTDPAASYGTPEMAEAVQALVQSDLRARSRGVIVMGGHEEGLLAFGPDLKQAYQRLMAALQYPSGG